MPARSSALRAAAVPRSEVADLGAREVARLDAAALADPLVARVHDPGQHGVGDADRRDLAPAAHDHGPLHFCCLPGVAGLRAGFRMIPSPRGPGACRTARSVHNSPLRMLTDLAQTPIAETLRRSPTERRSGDLQVRSGKHGQDRLLRPRPAGVRGQQPAEGPPGRGAGGPRPHHRRGVQPRLRAHAERDRRRFGEALVQAGVMDKLRARAPRWRARCAASCCRSSSSSDGAASFEERDMRDPARVHGEPVGPPPALRRHPLDEERGAGARRGSATSTAA